MIKLVYLSIIYANLILTQCADQPLNTSASEQPILLFNYDDRRIMYDYLDHNRQVIENEKSQTLYKTQYKVNGLDVDIEDKYFVWSSGEYPYVIYLGEYESRVDPKSGRTRFQVYKRSLIIANSWKPSRVAIDFIHDLVYYFNYTNLNVIDAHRPEVSYRLIDNKPQLYLSSELLTTGNLVVNPYESFVVWGEYFAVNGSATIRRCNSDGSHPRILVYRDIRLPVCVAIDYKTQTIMWIDNELHSLNTIDYEGNGRQTLKQSKQYFSDCQSMDVFNGSVYRK